MILSTQTRTSILAQDKAWLFFQEGVCKLANDRVKKCSQRSHGLKDEVIEE